MSLRTHLLPARVQMVRLVVLAGALFGLFAMHGLAGHGTMHQQPAAATTVSASVSAGMAPGMGGSPGALVDHPESGSVNTHDARDHPPIPADGSELLLGLCLAVLAAVLIGLAAVRSRRPVFLLVRRPVQVLPRPAGARRDRDPPCLFSLSIQRC